MTPPAAPEADTPTRVLDAAEKAFADQGFAGARVNGIAAEAGVNKAMLYYYFESKEGLYRAVFERAFDQIAAAAAAHLSGATEADILSFLRAYRGILRAHPHLARLISRDLADGGAHVVSILGPRVQGILGGVAGSLGQGMASGRFNPDINPLVAMPVLVAPFVFFALASPMLTAATGVPADAMAEPFDRTAEAILLRGLLARAPEAS